MAARKPLQEGEARVSKRQEGVTEKQRQRTLDEVIRVHRGRQRGRNVLGELRKQRADLFERARRLLAELGGGNLLGDGEEGAELEGLLGCANVLAVEQHIGGEL